MQNRTRELHKVERRLERARPGDILLFYNATGVNHLIPLLTRSPFFHVAIYGGDADVIESRPSGVVRRDLRNVNDIHDFVVIPAPAGAGRNALAWAGTQLGAGYDRLDALVIGLNRVFSHLHLNYNPGGKWTCGEFVATAFDRAGECLFPDMQLADVEPADFARLLPPEQCPPDLIKAEARDRLVAMATAVTALLVVAYAVRRTVRRG